MRLFSVWTLFSAAVLAQVTGRVVDSQNQPVPNARVHAIESGGVERTTSTDAQGRFRFEKLAGRLFLLQAETRDLESSAPLETSPGTDVTLTLTPRRVTERVTVTAESAPLSFDQTAKALSIVDGKEMAARQVYSVADALRTVPGLRIQQLGGPGALAQILTRGLRIQDTAVLIDGFRFRDVASVRGDASAYLGDLMVVNSDRLEVLRGSGSSLYGTNSTGGTINLVTDQGGGPLHGQLVADGGGLGMARGLARIGGALGKEDRFRYSAGLTHLNVSDGVDNQNPYRNTSGQAWGQYVFRTGSTLSARLMAADTFAQVNATPSAAPASQLGPANVVRAVPGVSFFPSAADPDRRRVSSFGSTMLAWNQALNPWANLRVSYQALLSARADRNGPSGAGFQPRFNTESGFDGRIDTVNARLDLTPVRSQSIALGYEFERESFTSPGRDENPNPAQRVNQQTSGRQQSNAIFAQSQSRWLRDRLLLSVSGRWQRFDLAPPRFQGGAPLYQGITLGVPPDALTGDAALAYLVPKSGTKLRAHVGNSYRVPSLYERFGSFFFGGAFSPIGDPRLRPDRSLAVDAGFDQYFAGNRLRVSGTVFYTRLQEVIGFATLRNDPFRRFSGYLNVGGGLSRGVEVEGEARPWRGMNLRASYTYTNADERSPILLGGVLSAIRIHPHLVTFVAMQQLGKRVNVAFDFLGASDYLSGAFFVGGGSRPFQFNGPRRGNLAVSYTLPLTDRQSMQFFTRVENVFNQNYFEDGFRTPKAWAVGGIRYQF